MIHKTQLLEHMTSHEKNMYSNYIIVDVLQKHHAALTRKEILLELKRLECKLTEQSLKVKLWRLRKMGKILSIKVKGTKYFFLF